MRARAFTGTLLLILLALSATFTYSQAPQGFSYQAVIRNSTGVVIANQSVSLRISLTAADATQYYVETQTATTTVNGVVNLTVGSGTLVSGSFATVPWSGGDVRLKVEVDPAGGTAFVDMGTTRFYSVPYALFAANGPVGPIGPAGKGILSVTDNGNGTLTFTFTDNSTFTTPNLTGLQGVKGDTGAEGPTGPQGPEGPKGDTGNGIATVEENGNGVITFNFTDNSTFTTPNLTGPQGLKGDTGAQGPAGPQGDKGNTGNGIATVMDDGNGIITFSFTDGSTYVTTKLTGPAGPQGIPGEIGPQGPIGEKGDKGDTGSQGLIGDTGNGITSVMDNANGTLTFNFTNGSTYTTPDLTGPEGMQGLPGAVGSQGPAGPKGDKGDTGDQGIQGIPGTGLNNKGEWATGTTYSPGDYVFSESSASSSVNTMWIVQASAAFLSSTLPKSDLTNWVEFEAPAGPQGPQGPVGPLVAGTAGQTLRHDGTTWVANSTLFNDGTNVGIGTTNPTHNLEVNGFARIGNVALNAGVEIDFNVYSDSRGRIFGYNRTSNAYNGLRLEGSDVLINANSGGKVGIGTITPAKKLQIHNTNADAHLYISNNAPSIQLGNNEVFGSSTMYGLFALATNNGNYGVNAGDVILGAYGNSRGNIYINSNYSGSGVKNIVMQPAGGNVGIGTTAPVALLDVKTSSNIHFGAFYSTAGAASIGAFNDGFSGWQPLSINPGGQVWFLGGNVGIGTTTPSVKLDVIGNARFGNYQAGVANINAFSMELGGPSPTGTSGQSTIFFHHHGAIAHQLRYTSGAFFLEAAGNGYGSSTTPSLSIGGSLYAGVNGGNIGIGTTSPGSYKLYVNGGDMMVNRGDGLGGNIKIAGHSWVGSADWGDLRLASGTNSGNTSIRFITENAERAYITGNGNFGIGVWPTAKLHVNGNALINGNTTFNGSIAGQSASGYGDVLFVGNDSKLVDVNVANTAAIYGLQNNAIATLRLGSGAADISGSAGNIGVGTTTPNAKMVVQGTSAVATDPLFQVKDKDGIPVFTVYRDSVRVVVSGEPYQKATDTKGAFAVSGRSASKANAGNYMRITPDNIFIGPNAGKLTTYLYYKSTSGIYNVAIGNNALVSNVSGKDNIAIGTQALFNSTSSSNTVIGRQAMYSNTSGSGNTAVGWVALRANTIGYYNTAIGYAADVNSGGWTNATAIGYGATATFHNLVRIGNNSVSSIGGHVGWSSDSDIRFKREIKSNVPGLDFILKLRPITYYFDTEALDNFLRIPDSLRMKNQNENVLQTGFAAQEVEEAAKSIGYDFNGVDKPKNENDFYRLRYSEFTIPLVKAVQELSADIEIQKTKNTELVKELEAQKKMNIDLIKRLEAIEQKLASGTSTEQLEVK